MQEALTAKRYYINNRGYDPVGKRTRQGQYFLFYNKQL